MVTERAQFGQITKLPSGRYRARYQVPGSQPRAYVNAPTTFARKGDAHAWLARQQTDIVDGIVRPKTMASRMTLREYAEGWLEARHNSRGEALRPSTRRVYEHYLTHHIYPDLGRMALPKIDRRAVESWHRALLPNRPTLRARTYALLRTLLTSAVDEGLIPANPCHIRGAGRVRPAVRKSVATPEQVEALAAAMPERLALAVHLGAWTQLRSGEVLELRRGDLFDGVVVVTRGMTWVDGKPHVGPPKTDAGERAVTIPPHVRPLVDSHLAKHVGPDSDALLFPARPDGGEQMNPSTFAYFFKAAVLKADLPKEFRFHWLRHTGLTWAAQAGATVAELQARAGHSTPSTAMLYQHATSTRDAALAQSLSELAGGRSTKAVR